MSDKPEPSTSEKPKVTWKEKQYRSNYYDANHLTNSNIALKNFMEAVGANDVAMVEIYLHSGQNPNSHMENYVTPLHIASIYGFEYLVELLLQHPEIDVNAVDNLGRTPLSRACRYSFLPIVKLLLEHKADCDIADRMGYTALHLAALWSYPDIMDILLRYDADPNMSNVFGKTPLHIACIDHIDMRMVQLLCENDADINLECTLVMPVLLACCLNCFDYEALNMVDLLIYYDADVNIIYSQNGQTALHIAAITGFVPLAEVLCTAGANPNIMDNQFRTPYDVALQMENDGMVQFLRIFFQEDAAPINVRQRRNAIIMTKSKRKRHYETF